FPPIHRSPFTGLASRSALHSFPTRRSSDLHPLYLHAVAITPAGPDDRSGMVLPVMTYDWFQLQYGDLFAFFDMVGSRTIYRTSRSEEHTSELQSRENLVCRLLLEKKKQREH